MSSVRTEWDVRYHVKGDIVVHFSKIGNYDEAAQRELAEKVGLEGAIDPLQSALVFARQLKSNVVEVIELDRPSYA